MRVGDRWLDQPSGVSGKVAQIMLLGGDDVDEVEPRHHELIGAVVVEADDGLWLVYGGPFVEGVDLAPISRAIH